MPDQTLFAQPRQRGEGFLERALARGVDVAHQAQIDHLEPLEAEIAQVVVDGAGQIRRALRGEPGAVRVANRADLGDDHQIVRIGMQRLADDLVGDVRTVEVAGVDVVDPSLDGGAQHRDGCGAVARRAEDAGTGELHRAVTDALHDAIGEGEGSGMDEIGHRMSPEMRLSGYGLRDNVR